LAYYVYLHLQTKYIKAQRIRSLQENEIRKIDEDESGEFIIINYSIMALIQLDLVLLISLT
jgi:hypothetical protein